MQELPSGSIAAPLVILRGDRWRVVERVRHRDCEALRLRGAGTDNVGIDRTFLLPFDRPAWDARERRTRLVGRARWMRAFQAQRAACAAAGELRAAGGASISILPWQLEPALAVVRGEAVRLLLADEVGLGKTIQAGLVLGELAARGLADRVLIVTPAGLRDQWTRELEARFRTAAPIVDAASVRRAVASLAPGVNPWSVPGWFIVSLDFLKRPEILSGVLATLWDAVVIDEAHAAAGRSDRHAAADALCRRARVTLLVTATPHAGDEAAFDSLCAIGRLGGPADRLVVFRRTRRDVGLPSARRTRVIGVRLTERERHMHDLLDRYARRVWAETTDGGARLAMAILKKRALSSPWSLAASAARRLQWLADRPGDGGTRQLALPLADDGETDEEDAAPDGSLAVPGLADRGREIAWVRAVLASARAAAGDESKLAALARLLRRAREPVIVFTEYRDTLARLAACGRLGPAALLHGALSRRERVAALERFERGETRLLLATDAASEGLNLQSRCRWIVNYDLPWNPVRIEQRAGRVDRLGQTRAPHTLLLAARGGVERTVLARLVSRIGRIRAASGAGPFFGGASDLTVADALIHGNPGLLDAVETRPNAPRHDNPILESAGSVLTELAGREALRLRSPLDFARGDPEPVEGSGQALRLRSGPSLLEATELPELSLWPPRSLWTIQRGLAPRGDVRHGLLVDPDADRLLVAAVRRSRLARTGLDLCGGSAVAIYRLRVRDGCGRDVDVRLAPAVASVADAGRQRPRASLARAVAAALRPGRPAIDAALAGPARGAHEATRTYRRAIAMLLDRERALQRQLRAALPSRPVQAGLFDRRALREAAATHHALETLRAASEAHEARLEQAMRMENETELAMVLIVGK